MSVGLILYPISSEMKDTASNTLRFRHQTSPRLMDEIQAISGRTVRILYVPSLPGSDGDSARKDPYGNPIRAIRKELLMPILRQHTTDDRDGQSKACIAFLETWNGSEVAVFWD